MAGIFPDATVFSQELQLAYVLAYGLYSEAACNGSWDIQPTLQLYVMTTGCQKLMY